MVHWRRACSLCDDEQKEEGNEEGTPAAGETRVSGESYDDAATMSSAWSDAASAAAVGAVRFYKAAISPVLPRSCRFVPSCSSYSIEAFESYGFARGMVLTAWRIMRCTPFGGRGYDPPSWPPVRYRYVGIVERHDERRQPVVDSETRRESEVE